MSSQADRQQNLLNACLDSLEDLREIIQAHQQGDELTESSKLIEDLVAGYCQVDFDEKKCLDALNQAESTKKAGEDLEALYHQKLNEDQTRLDLKNCEIWRRFYTQDNSVLEIDPGKVDQLADDQFDELDESIACSNVFTPPIDPISKNRIKDPCRNTKCNHVYEHKFIVQYIKTMKAKAKCPYGGCINKQLRLRDIVMDPQLKDRIFNYEEVQKQSPESDSDD